MAAALYSNHKKGDVAWRVLVFAPFGKDGALIMETLERAAIRAQIVARPDELIDEISSGAGSAVLTEEALDLETVNELGRVLSLQPTWSDLPIIVLTGGGASTPETEFATRSWAPLGNLTLLERPLRAATLVRAVQTALRARERQYEIKRAQESLELQVEQRTAALRALSARLLHVQDEERRRIARELHDSLGQRLAAAKLSIEMLARNDRPQAAGFTGALDMLDRAISETRTISHLLHPPLLDEVGFASAAKWYVEGFGKRSGIATKLIMPSGLQRLPRNTEIALFRILQEALTNVHRHSGSKSVEILIDAKDCTVMLTVQDAGRGVPQHVLEGFQKTGMNVGVGLAGIRERVKELGGALDIQTSESGTRVTATVPIPETAAAIPD